jgi:hypothetical protein
VTTIQTLLAFALGLAIVSCGLAYKVGPKVAAVFLVSVLALIGVASFIYSDSARQNYVMAVGYGLPVLAIAVGLGLGAGHFFRERRPLLALGMLFAFPVYILIKNTL